MLLTLWSKGSGTDSIARDSLEEPPRIDKTLAMPVITLAGTRQNGSIKRQGPGCSKKPGFFPHEDNAMKDRLITVVLSVATTYGLTQADSAKDPRELEVDRLIVRRELIVSDTGSPWEKGYEAHQIPRGIYARSLWDGPGGLWVRSRLIKGEIDDPFDDRFHALERDGTMRLAPAISRGTSGSMAHGGKWPSSKAKDWRTPKCPTASGTEQPTLAGSAFSHSVRATASR